MNVLEKLSEKIKVDYSLSSEVIGEYTLKIKFNFFIRKNVDITNAGFKIRDSYLLSSLSPLLLIVSYKYYKKCNVINETIIQFLEENGYIFQGVLQIS